MKKSLENVEEVIEELEDALNHADGGESAQDFCNKKLSPILGEIDRRMAILREKISSFQSEVEGISRRMDANPSS